MSEDGYLLKTNEENKAMKLNFCCSKVGKNVKQGVHMRAFWASAGSGFMAYVGWYALVPYSLDVAHSIGICENQIYDPAEEPRREAFVNFEPGPYPKAPAYCNYGKNEDGSDCNEPPEKPACEYGENYRGCKEPPANADCKYGMNKHGKCNEPPETADCKYGKNDKGYCNGPPGRRLWGDHKYNRGSLPKCLCSVGTHCANTLTISALGSVGMTLLTRFSLGTFLERFGPINVQCFLLIFGAFWVAASAAISADWNLILIRSLIGCVGGAFTTNMFWCSLMFAPRIVGTANSLAAAVADLGGGLTQIVMIGLLRVFESFGLSTDMAWRVSMLVPAIIFILTAIVLKRKCWDLPTAKRFDKAAAGQFPKISLYDYVECLKDIRVVVMIFQYSACLGVEVVLEGVIVTHLAVNYLMDGNYAVLIVRGLLGMSYVTRPVGGTISDVLFTMCGFRGRIWAQFLMLFCAGLALCVFAFMKVSSRPGSHYVVIGVLATFIGFGQMGSGTSFGIVPLLRPQQQACVHALVSVGGSLAAFLSLGLYATSGANMLPFKLHACYILFWALMSVTYFLFSKAEALAPTAPAAKAPASAAAKAPAPATPAAKDPEAPLAAKDPAPAAPAAKDPAPAAPTAKDPEAAPSTKEPDAPAASPKAPAPVDL